MYTPAAFILFCVACTVLAFKRHPIYGLYLYLGMTFIFPQGRWWGHIFQDLRLSLLAAAVTVAAVVLHRGKLKPKPLWLANPPALILSLYAALMWLQSPWALDLKEHLSGCSFFVKYLLAFWFVYRVVDSKEKVRDVLLALVLGNGLLGLYAQFTGRDGDRLDGVGGPGIDDSNTLGMYLATGAILGVGLVLTQKGWRRYLSLACVVVITNGVVLANSRGALLGLVAGGLVLALCKARQHRAMFWSFALLSVLGLAVIVDQAFIDRMVTIQDVTSKDDEADGSARSRVEIAKAQLQMFKAYPMGAGHRGTATLSPQYLDAKWLTKPEDSSQAARSSHNTFLTTLVEQGVLGGFLYLCLALWIVVAGRRVQRMRGPLDDPELVTLGATTCAGLAVVFVAGNSADYLLVENQFWLFAVMVSMLQLAAQRTTVGGEAGDVRGLRRMAA